MIKEYSETNQVDLLPLLKTIIDTYSIELKNHSAEKTGKIAWCSSAGPVELLRAMDFEVYFPEKHWQLLGPIDSATDLDPVKTSHLKSPEFPAIPASDHDSNGIGRANRDELRCFSNKDIPKPDLLVFNTLQGREVKDWLNWYARSLGKPVVGIDTARNLGEICTADLKSVVLQLRNMVLMLEAITGRKFDIDRLREVITTSRKCAELWQSCLKLSAYLPAPWSYFDHLQFIFPAVVLRGKKNAIEFYERLFSELIKRVQQGKVTVDEQIRLMWRGTPLWPGHGQLSATLRSLKASVVASTSCNCWDLSALEESQPFVSMARVYSSLYLGRDQDYQCTHLNRLRKEFRVDGMLYNNTSVGNLLSPHFHEVLNRLATTHKVPFLKIGRSDDCNSVNHINPAISAIEQFVEHLQR
jgi:benzoyl-CoA reductase/2-hydroxyglutaryl-CoA dehydratase subunit BcrC/BadD/HgdB